MPNQSAEHSKLVNALLISLSQSGLGFFWKNATGAQENADGTFIRYGFPGSSDILGCLQDGTICCIEAKTGNAVQSKAQKAFQATIEKNHGVYLVARDITTVLLQLERINAHPTA